ncbi:MAG: Ig-like domain-containing protein [Candidatus Magasanikbacteria bacterium]
MLQWLSKNRFIKAAAISVVILVAVFLFFNTVSAQSLADPNSPLLQGVTVIQEPLGLPVLDIRLIIARIIRVVLGLIGIILVVLMIYAGYLWMTAGGNDEQITQSKKIITNAVIGLAIILSAYGIVSFVINMLGVPSGSGTTTTTYSPGTQNFTGSGALGKTIKDHYPARNQTGVPRNTKIVITFTRPVLLSSFVDDYNGTGIFGDCKNTDKPTFSWFDDCDHVVSTTLGKLSDKFINVSEAVSGQSIKALVVMATTSTVNNVTGIYTIVLKPITDGEGGFLGNASDFVLYTVHLGNGILADDSVNNNPSIFQNQKIGNDFYYWQFTTSNLLDISPPFVTDVYPKSNTTEFKNSVIQISFSEPMNPTGVQGSFSTTVVGAKTYYSLSGNRIFADIQNSLVPVGNFNLINNYQTLEFTPSYECGKNACGNPIYCLPVCNKPGAVCKEDSYQILLEAAKTFLKGSFESVPFTGIADMSGNALDGNSINLDGKPDGIAQTATTSLPVFDNWKQPDNYFWTFKIKDEIDATSPYIKSMTPGVSAQNVPKDAALSLYFSKRMRADSAYNIEIEEHPTSTNNISLWKVPFVHLDYQTFDILHGPFLDSIKQIYIPIVGSNVEDVHFNCFYPGVGPKDVVPSGSLDSKVCDLSDPVLKLNCCDVKDEVGSEFCCNGKVISSQNGTQTCIEDIKVKNKLP